MFRKEEKKLLRELIKGERREVAELREIDRDLQVIAHELKPHGHYPRPVGGVLLVT